MYNKEKNFKHSNSEPKLKPLRAALPSRLAFVISETIIIDNYIVTRYSQVVTIGLFENSREPIRHTFVRNPKFKIWKPIFPS